VGGSPPRPGASRTKRLYDDDGGDGGGGGGGGDGGCERRRAKKTNDDDDNDNDDDARATRALRKHVRTARAAKGAAPPFLELRARAAMCSATSLL
jgi:hypothetical protein